jgi:hypothetical protein
MEFSYCKFSQCELFKLFYNFFLQNLSREHFGIYSSRTQIKRNCHIWYCSSVKKLIYDSVTHILITTDSFIHRRLKSRMDLWPPFSGFLDHIHTDTR